MRALKLTGILASSLIFTTPQVMASPLKMSLNGGTAFKLKDTVDYSDFSATPSSISATANQAIICHNRTGGTPSANIQMQIHDPNDSAAAALGVLDFSQSIDGDLISVTTDSVTRCVIKGEFLGDSDLIFANGFESGIGDLFLVINGLGTDADHASVSPNQELNYSYTITNNGHSRVTFDFVDYFPKNGEPYLQDNPPTPGSTVSWSCEVSSGSGSCGPDTASGDGTVELLKASLPKNGDTLTITVHRKVVSSTIAGSIEILAAIFANNDGNETDNVKYRNLMMTDNRPPVFTTTPEDQIIDEGSNTDPLSFAVSDPEGAAVTVTASSNNQTVIPNNNITVDQANSEVSIEPAANQYTTTGNPVTITLTATDVGGATATTTFDVTVTLVNEKPTFEVKPVVVVNLLSFASGTTTVDCNSSRASGSSGSRATLNVSLENCIYDINLGINEHNSQEIDSVILGDQDSTPAIPGVVENDPTNPIISVSSITGAAQVGFEIVDRNTVKIKPTLTETAGAAQVTLKLKDNGGGNDTSDPKTFLLKVIEDVSITKKAYISTGNSWDRGDSCDDTAVAVDELSVATTDTVTFCYIVTNHSTDTLLLQNDPANAAIKDDDFNINSADQIYPVGSLATISLGGITVPAGQSRYFYYKKTDVTAGLYYKAKVTAQDGGTTHSASNNRFEPVTVN